MKRLAIPALLVLGLLLTGGTPAVHAHGNNAEHAETESTAYGEQLEFGRVGKTAEAKRTIEVAMTDLFRFTPERIQVRAGETVRLVFRNSGAQVHEWVIGTAADISKHGALMRRFPNMAHDEPHNVHVPAGEARTLIWQFNRPGRFEFACLAPGHFEAGMKGFVEAR